MTIAQALKEKNKKTQLLSKLFAKLHGYNSIQEGQTRPYDLDQVWKEINECQQSLIDLKTAIHRASEPVRSSIFKVSELKNMILKIRGLDTKAGSQRHYDSDLKYTAHFDILWKDSLIDSLENEIDQIQATLDSFNHITHI
jgi:chromosome segregation ATPase